MVISKLDFQLSVPQLSTPSFLHPFNKLPALLLLQDRLFGAVVCHFFLYQVVVGIVLHQVDVF